jgi:general secretion pathway protein K
MKIRFLTQKNNRGMALLITLTIITLVIAASVELNRKVRQSVISAASSRDRMTMSYMTSAGIHAAMAMLIKDKSQSRVDSVQEDWANPEKIGEFLRELEFKKGKLKVSIEDELGKIQANALVKFPKGRNFNGAQRSLWEQFSMLLLSRYEEELESTEIEPLTIINSVKDWLDSKDDDAITGISGAETDYYEGLDPPYECKNGPFTHLGEMLLVKGVKEEIYYGLPGLPGISTLMTIYGIEKAGDGFTYPGKININTASLPVLAALLPLEYADLAQSIYDFREEKSEDEYVNDLTGASWYKNAPGCADLNIRPDLITLASDYFRIEAIATLNDNTRKTTVVIRREKLPKSGKYYCKVLDWTED